MGTDKSKPKGERQKSLEEKTYFGEATSAEGGRAGGDLQREVATRDTLKRAFDRPAGKTRVRKKHERK